METKLSYIQLLQLSDKEKELQDIQYLAAQGNLQLQADILATNQELIEANQRLSNSKGAFPFNSQNILNAQADVESATNGLAALNALQTELFPTVTTDVAA